MVASVKHPIFARIYARVSVAAERAGSAAHRGELLAGAQGRVVEVGAGNGLNFAHYPSSVDEVFAIEPEAYLRARAETAANRAPLPITVVAGTAEDLPVEDASFDVAVVSLVLCSVRDQPQALREIHRVLRPGGELRFYEHVRSDTAALERAQRIADKAVWPAVAGGCHAGRETRSVIIDAGFMIEEERRFLFKPSVLAVLTTPHIIGRARRS